jgi:chromosome segregation protein
VHNESPLEESSSVPDDDALESAAETSTSTGVKAAGSSFLVGAPVDQVEVISLVLENFKSFIEKTPVDFRRGFTTISGPNGSGKSNIIDSLLFVLGLSSSKGMRAERLTDLMSANSKKKVSRVSLKLRVHHSDGVVRDLEIARRVRLRGENYDSRYEVDGQVLKAQELQELLLELGLTASGMNVVLQGDVMRLATMSPLNRRRVLDETAGIAEFDKRITAAREELTQAERHMSDIGLILRELEGRLDALRAERETALEYRRLREAKLSMEDDLRLLSAQQARDEVVDLQRRLDDLTRKRDKAREAYSESLVRAEEALRVFEAAEAAYRAKGEGERLNTVKRRESVNGRVETIGERLTRIEHERQQVKKAEGEREIERGRLQLRSKELEQREGEAQAKLDELGDEHMRLSAEVAAAMAQIRKHGAAQADKLSELNRLQVVTRTARSREDELSRRIAELDGNFGKLTTEGEVLRERVEGDGQRREGLARRLDEIASSRREARERQGEAEEKLRRLVEQQNRLRSERERAGERLSDVRDQLARAEEKVRAGQVYTNNHAVNTIKSSQISGVLGTVRELCQFDSEYAEAIDAAAGGRLQWVVVEDEHCAKQCIELLKRTQAGRLTFVPLTKLQTKPVHYGRLSGAGIINYAIELIEYDARFDQVFEDVFGDTVIVDTLQNALPSINRFRMVTLEGDLLEKGGRMTGGRSRNSQSRLLADVSKAEQDSRKLQESQRKIEAERAALLKETEQVEAEGRQAAAALASLREKTAEAGAQEVQLREELEAIDKVREPARQRLVEIEARLREIQSELEVLRVEHAEVSATLARDDDRLRGLTAENEGSEFDRLSQETGQKELRIRDLEETSRSYRDLNQKVGLDRRSVAERQATLERDQQHGAEALQALAEEHEVLEGERQAKKAELAVLDEELGKIARELEALEQQRKAAIQAQQRADQAVALALRDQQASELGVTAAQEKFEKAREAVQDRIEDLRARKLGPLPEYPEGGYQPGEDPKTLALETERELQRTAAKMQSLEPVNMLAIDQYDEIEGRQTTLRTRFDELTREKDAVTERMAQLEEAKRRTFMEAFEAVRASFKESFRELARGEGELQLENPLEPFEGGLIIEARPRGKAFARLEAMSGGEKSLTALAFIFALQSVNPAPFYIFDEVDQSLDGANTELLAMAIQRRSRARQYLVVSHHQAMLNESDQLLGVSMRKGYGTRVTGIALKDEPEARTNESEVAAAQR